MADDPIKSVSDLFECDAPLRCIADKYFPNDCYERYVLLKTADSYGQLAMYTLHLAQAQKHLERIRSIDVPDKSAIFGLALYLEKISATLHAQATSEHAKEAADAVKQASQLLDIWYSLYLNLDPLMKISADFLFLTDRSKGNA